MSTSLARTADGWWAVTPAGLVRLGLPATTTAGLLAMDKAIILDKANYNTVAAAWLKAEGLK